MSPMIKKEEFTKIYLKLIQKNLEKELPDEGFDDEMLKLANSSTVKFLLHLSGVL